MVGKSQYINLDDEERLILLNKELGYVFETLCTNFRFYNFILNFSNYFIELERSVFEKGSCITFKRS